MTNQLIDGTVQNILLEGDPLKRKVTVVGAGFSGLTTAYYLLKEGFDVRIVESREKAGGLIQTVDDAHGITETAANAILSTVQVEELFQTIGVEILPTLKASKKRFIFRDGKPQRWPFTLDGTFKLVAFFARFIFKRQLLAPHAFETVRDWGERVLGDEVTSYGIEPALQGIYAGDSSRMSATLIFGKYFGRKSAKKKKPKIRGSISARGGMGEIISKLHDYLVIKEVEFSFGENFHFAETHSPTNPVVLATSAKAASRILRPLDSERASALAQVELLPVLSATVFFDSAVRRAAGFGCLFPPAETRPALGVLMNSYIFRDRAKTGFSETWIFGGALAHSNSMLALDDQEIITVIEKQRGECFLTVSERLSARVTRWPQALPHYTTDLEKILPIIQRNRQNVFLIGNYTGEIGLSRILEKAKLLARQVHLEGESESPPRKESDSDTKFAIEDILQRDKGDSN